VPVDGVIALAWSLDHIGVFGRTVADAALGFRILIDRPLDPAAPRAPRLALAPELLARAAPETAARIQAAADQFARAGASVVEVKLPASFDDVHTAGLTVLEAESAAYHADNFRRHAAEYGPEIRALVDAGLKQAAPTFVRANRARLRFRDEMMPLLTSHHALLAPTAPAPAPAGLHSTGDGSLCAPWSYSGVPAITLPSGLNGAGLPEAIQLVAAAGQEALLFDVAQWCEDALRFSAAPSL
jgi:Asp-tRNA(Asn)/Glu-tRNA(Gln) amidotransferase A subunit family amidase